MPEPNGGLQLEKVNVIEIQRQSRKLDDHIEQGNIRVEQIYKDFREYVDTKGSNNWPVIALFSTLFITLLLGVAGLLYQQINTIYERIHSMEDGVKEWRQDCSSHQDEKAHARALEINSYQDRDISELQKLQKQIHPSVIGLEKSLDAKMEMLNQKMVTELSTVERSYNHIVERLEAFDDRMNRQEVFKQQAAWFNGQLKKGKNIPQ